MSCPDTLCVEGSTLEIFSAGLCEGLGDVRREREPGSGRFLHEATLWERLKAALPQTEKGRPEFRAAGSMKTRPSQQ